MSGNSIGSVLGGGIGFLVGGPTGAKWGFMLGGMIGGYVDPQKIRGPRLTDATRQTSQEGVPIPWGYGTFPTTGNIIFAGPLVEHEHKEGGKGGPQTISYTYTRTYEVGVCEGEISGLQQVKRNGKLVYDISPTSTITAENSKFLEKCTIYLGDETQLVDPAVEAIVGVNNSGPNRGLAKITLEDDDLTDTQGGISQYEFVVNMCGTVTGSDDYLMSLGPEFYYPLHSDGVDRTGRHGDFVLYNDATFTGGGMNTGDGTGAAYAGLTSLNLAGAAGGECTAFISLTIHVEPTTNSNIGNELVNDAQGFVNWQMTLTDDAGVGDHRYLHVRVNGAAGGGQSCRSPNPIPLGQKVVCGFRCENDLLECIINGTVVNSVACVGGLIAGGSAQVQINEYFHPPGDQYTVSEYVGVRRAVTNAEMAKAMFYVGVLPEGATAIPDAPGAYIDADGNVVSLGGEQIASCQAVLSEIFDDLCDRSGIDVATEVDSSQLTDLVTGFKCATEAGADSFIESLTMSHFFDRGEWDKKVRGIKRGGANLFALTPDDLVARDGPAIDWTQIQEPELLRKVNVLSIDPAAEYNMTKQTWERRAGTIRAKGEASVEIPEVIATDTAAQIAEIRGKIAWAENAKAKFGLSVKWSNLTPTDPGTFTDKNGIVHRIRLADLNEELGVFSVDEAPKDRAAIYTGTVTGVTNSNTPGSTTPGLVGPTLFVAMNLPQMRSQDGSGLYVGMAGMLPGWHGAQLLMSVDGGVSYQPVLTINTPTIMGPLTANVDASGSASEPLSVEIYGGDLSSATSAQVAQGVNLSAVLTENSAGDIAEVLAYEVATETSPGFYDLSTLSRGLKGTDPDDHYTGDFFMDMATAYFVPISTDYAGQTLYFKAVGLGVSADAVDAVPVVYDPPDTIINGGGDPL